MDKRKNTPSGSEIFGHCTRKENMMYSVCVLIIFSSAIFEGFSIFLIASRYTCIRHTFNIPN